MQDPAQRASRREGGFGAVLARLKVSLGSHSGTHLRHDQSHAVPTSWPGALGPLLCKPRPFNRHPPAGCTAPQGIHGCLRRSGRRRRRRRQLPSPKLRLHPTPRGPPQLTAERAIKLRFLRRRRTHVRPSPQPARELGRRLRRSRHRSLRTSWGGCGRHRLCTAQARACCCAASAIRLTGRPRGAARQPGIFLLQPTTPSFCQPCHD
jgi:hypothetical protein